MFLDVLRRRNPGFIEAAMRLHQEGRLPANAYVLDLDAVEANARLLKTEADRLGLKVFAMTKQVGRVELLLPGGAARRHRPRRSRSTWPAPAQPIAPAWPFGHLGHLSQVAARRSGGGGRCPAAGLLDGVQRRPRRARRGAAARRRLHPGPACPHPGRRRHLLSRPRGRLRRSRRGGRGRPRSTRSTAAASPASPPFRRCSSTRTSRKVLPTPQPGDAGAGRRGAGPGRARRHRGQRARHHLDGHAGRAGRGRRDADASRATGCTAPRALHVAGGSAGAAGRALPDRGIASRAAARPIASAAASTSIRSFRPMTSRRSSAASRPPKPRT